MNIYNGYSYQHHAGKAGAKIMEKAKFDLLKPFDIKAAKQGEPVHHCHISGDLRYVMEPNGKGEIIFEEKEF